MIFSKISQLSFKYHTFTILYINCLQERAGGGEGVVLNREITIYHKLKISRCSQSYLFSKSFPVNFISPGWLFVIFFASNPLLRKNGG